VRPGLAITVVAALAATTACGGGDDRLGEELPPVRISSVSTSSTPPTTTEPATATTSVTTTTLPLPSTTAATASVIVPISTLPTTTSQQPTTTSAPASSTSPTTIAPAAASTAPPTTAPTTAGSSGNGPGTIEGGATVGGGAGRGGASPADRVDPPTLLAWIGGADVVDEDLSLPAAAAARLGRIDGRPVEVRAFTDADPDIAAIGQLVDDAIADGAAGIVLAISPTLAGFGGTGDCDDLTPDDARIACLLEPPTGSQLDERTAELEQLADDLVASDLPLFVYISGVSSQALADVELGPDIATAEAAIAAVDPTDFEISFGTETITRDVPGADEGTAFLDALTPSAEGIELLAGLLTPDIETFFEQRLG